MTQGLPTGETLKRLGLAAVGLVSVALIGAQIGSHDYKVVAFALLVVVGTWLVFFSGEYFWIITIAAASLAGSFPVLGGQFTPFQILMGIGVGKFFVEDMILKRKRIKPGPSFDRWMIFGFMAIVAIHAIHDRFGMKFLGSNVWGGRNYINLFIALAAFFVVQTVSIKSAVWRKIPYFAFAVCGFDLFISLLTTAFPKLIYVIYPFYSAVSRTGVEELLNGQTTADTTRLGAVGNFGVLLVAFVFATTRWQRLIHPSNLLRLSMFSVGWVSILLSSFRSSVVTGLAVMLVAAIRDLRWAAVVVLAPAAGAVLFALSYINSNVVELPKPMQRSLTFMPGSWDSAAVRDANDSNQWRSEIWDLWKHDYFPEHPWLGRGYGFHPERAAASVFHYRVEDNRAAVEVGEIHNGLFSAIDGFGIIGAIFFLIWNVGLLIRIFRLRFDPKIPENTTLWFVALGIGASILCYWGGAETSGAFISHQIVAVSVLIRLRDLFEESRARAERESAISHLPEPVAVAS